MKIRNLKNVNLRGKYVLLREDFNVQIVDGVIKDSFRIDSALKTIKRLVNAGARVVICSHLGRPKGERVEDLSLRIVAEYLNIPFVDDCLRKDFLPNMKNGDVVLLENLRFYVGEENKADYKEDYDTYTCYSLPQGPVCNPGMFAINAALYPEETDYYYFCHDKDGNTYYAKTYSEHLRNCDKAGL